MGAEVEAGMEMLVVWVWGAELKADMEMWVTW